MTKRTIPVLVASYCPVPVKKIFYTAPVILLLLFPVLCSVAQTISSNAVPVVTAVTNGSFESNTVTDPAGYSYTPNIVATGWTLGNTHAGLTKNNTAFTAGNPGTTAGVQVLFLQIAGSAETTINMPAAGYYRFSMRAAKRGNGGGNQTIAVSMNGTVFDTIKPASIQYNLYRTGVVFMNAGNNVLKLQGLSVGVDNTAFIDDVKYERIASWSATASWTGGVVPSAASQVVIDAGEAVVLDVNTTVKNLHIQGELIAARDKDLQLGSDWIMVNGPGAILNWGTPTTPYKRKAVITLRGVFTNDTANVNNWKAGENFLASRNYGTIEMHGESKMSWTQLEATALKNQGTITVKDITNWSVGDSIVIASTDFNPTQAEVKAITAISGKTITLNSPLTYMHYGVTHTYNGLVLDERAEVGLLTRNIRIQSNNPVNGFGGHCMFLNNGKARFSGVEFLNLGQKARKGRYPLHWHELGSMNGQYVQFSSIHNSFNRAVAIHDTDSGRIENNVAYNHIGHGFYLEDNLSTRNYFYRNLGILTRLPAAGEAIEPHDRTPNATLGSTLFTTPVTFWINHPDNDFIENVAAGSDGSGFWYLGQNNQKMGLNINNRGHSNTFNFTVDGNINAAGVFTYGHFRPPAGQTPLINGFTSFKARERGLWTRADQMYFDNCRLADCPRNTFFAFNQQLRSSLVVGKSPNIGNPVTTHETNAGRSLALPGKDRLDEFNIFYGHSLYDGPSGVSNVHFAEFYGDNAFAFSIFAAAQKSPVHWAESVSFQAGMADANKINFKKSTDAEMMFTSGLIDRNGSITGNANNFIMPKILPHPHPNYANMIWDNGYNRLPAATENTNWGAYINTGSPMRLYRVDDFTGNTDTGHFNTYPQYNIRSDGQAVFAGPTAFLTVPAWHQNPVIVNNLSYSYYWQRHKIPYRSEAALVFANNNDYMISVFPNMPSGVQVYGPITTSGTPPVNSGTLLPKVTTLTALQNATTQSWFITGNTLYIKHIAAQAGYPEANTPFGYGMRSAPVNICLKNNCEKATQILETTEVTFADLELGNDPRFSITRTGSGTAAPSLVYDATSTSDPNDATNSKVSYTINKIADAFDDIIDVRITVPRQIWREFNHIKMNITGSNFQVIVHDNGNGDLNLGTFAPATNVTIPLNAGVNATKLDNVVGLTIRIRESNITGSSVVVNLFNIALTMGAPGTVSPTVQPGAEELLHAQTEQEIKIAPNPVREALQLQATFAAAESALVTVFNEAGAQVYQTRVWVTRGNSNYRFNLPKTLSAGNYRLYIETRNSGKRNSVFQLVR